MPAADNKTPRKARPRTIEHAHEVNIHSFCIEKHNHGRTEISFSPELTDTVSSVCFRLLCSISFSSAMNGQIIMHALKLSRR